MTENSLISNLMSNNDNWREVMESKKIRIYEYDNYVLLSYGIGPNFNDPIVKEARGIILDKETLNVVCWPFNKFGKYDDYYADDIDWSTARVQEKIDGSIIKLWYDARANVWRFSSNTQIYLENAKCSDTITSLYDELKRATNYKDLEELINNDKLNKTYTYIFELVGPDNRMVINYHESKIYHIGTRNNISGQEYNIGIGIAKPKTYLLTSLDKCIDCIDLLNRYSDNSIGICSYEGFVVVDANFHRIKIKAPVYSMLHNIATGSKKSKRILLELIDSNRLDVESMCLNYKDIAPFIKYYDFKYTEVMCKLNRFVNICRKVYTMCGKDKKLLSTKIKDHPFASIAFRSLDNDLSVKQLLDTSKMGRIEWLLNHIENYDPENYSYIFDILNQE